MIKVPAFEFEECPIVMNPSVRQALADKMAADFLREEDVSIMRGIVAAMAAKEQADKYAYEQYYGPFEDEEVYEKELRYVKLSL